METEERFHKDRARTWLSASQEERLQKEKNLLTPKPQPSSLQNHEKINLILLSHSACGIVMATQNTGLKHVSIPKLMVSVYMCVLVVQSCPTLCYPVDYSLPGSSFHGVLQARIW